MPARRTLGRLAAAVSLSGGLLVGMVAPASAAPATTSYYLSLGDSLAFGYQPDLVAAGDANPADYVGYAEDVAAMRPHLSLVNFGCPGETTGTMLAGGCPWPYPLHSSYGTATSQAGAAEAFLATHPGEVSLISVDIGSNDLLGLVDSCSATPDPSQCIGAGVPATLTTLATNYATLLAHLRALAPTAHLVLFTYYNPLALVMPGSDQFAAAASSVVDGLASAFHASVADAFAAINLSPGSPAERAFLCTRTWMCTTYANIHPTDLGYRALATALVHAGA